MARLVWKGRGRLKTAKKDIYYDQDIPEEIQTDLGKKRIDQLKAAGKIGKETDQERIDKIRAKAGAKAAKAVKASPPAPPAPAGDGLKEQ